MSEVALDHASSREVERLSQMPKWAFGSDVSLSGGEEERTMTEQQIERSKRAVDAMLLQRWRRSTPGVQAPSALEIGKVIAEPLQLRFGSGLRLVCLVSVECDRALDCLGNGSGRVF